MQNHNNKKLKPNRLITEKSPYLLQHAYNPVDWYPWSEEAFEKAQKENKPIFLSIGYSTCHWCHVMAHESFEDLDVAKILNETFVCIKVDREERPDIDKTYMTFCQMMSDHCGWPLTIIMTPEKEPFFVGTYIPRESRYGMVGIIDLAKRIADLWKNQRGKIKEFVEEVMSAASAGDTLGKIALFNEAILYKGFNELKATFDSVHGGFGTKPKFPTPHKLMFLLRFHKRTRDKTALDMVTKTLDSMRLGGIYDHIGFGFHRYSTDHKWHLPHFEKMLYDQALIAFAYTEAYQVTKNEDYKKIVEEIFEYVLRQLQAPEGGFYSSEDADSEGEEGKFYVWSYNEVKSILSENEFDLFQKIFAITRDGNFLEEASRKKVGKKLLHMKKPLNEIAKELQIQPDILKQRYEKIRKKLFEQREKRVHPAKDMKIIVDWNGLIIAALAKAGVVFNNQKFVEASKNATEFIIRNLQEDKYLLHRYKEGEWKIKGFLDDYAFFIWGLLELYESIFEPRYLKFALNLASTLVEKFWDHENYGFFFVAEDSRETPIRNKEIYDGAIPSGNSVAVLDLLRISSITADSKLKEIAEDSEQAFYTQIERVSSSYTYFLNAINYRLGPSHELVIAGKYAEKEIKEAVSALNITFLPNLVTIVKDIDNSNKIEEIIDMLKYYKTIEDKTIFYLCQNFVCKQPTTRFEKLLNLFNA